MTTRSKARKSKRAKKNAEPPADISQVLGMTPTRGKQETLASATALQRARAAAQQQDRDAAFAAAQNKSAWARRNKPRNSDAYLGSPHDSQVDWTREDGYVSTDADDEEEDKKTHERDEEIDAKHDEDAAAALAAAAPNAKDDEAAALAAAEDAACPTSALAGATGFCPGRRSSVVCGWGRT